MTEPISQYHYGQGDNVRDKIINRAISPKALLTPIHSVLTSLRHRQLEQAKEKLTTINSTSSLDTDTIALLNIIQLLVKLTEDNPPADSYQLLNSYLATDPDQFCRDIAISAQIQLDAKHDNHLDAHTRYTAKKRQGIYTNEAYYALIANLDEIKSVFNEQRLQLTEIELCGLVRGALRLEAPDEALEIAKLLHSILPDLNSKTLILFTKICLFNKTISESSEARHYWSITASSRRNLLNLCDETVCLMNNCKGNDTRVVNIATSLLNHVLGEYQPLADVCWDFISKVEAQSPDIASEIRRIYERKRRTTGGISGKIAKAQEDPAFKSDTINEITKSTNISAEDSFLLSNIGDQDTIQKWLGSGGAISNTNQLVSDVALLELKTMACKDTKKAVAELQEAADEFTNKHQADLGSLDPRNALSLAEKLFNLEIFPAACELLKPHIPSSDIWASPILQCYLNALLYSQKMMSLNSILEKIDINDWDDVIWQIKARQLGHGHNYKDAINAAEKALVYSNTSRYSWSLLIYFHNQNDSNKDLISQVVNRIPDEIFSQPSEIGYQLLSEIVRIGDFSRAEFFIIDWFIKNPDHCAIPFTDFYLSIILKGHEELNPSPTVGDCHGGLQYSCDGKITTKLLVTEKIAPHPSLINISSPLGQLLSAMDIEDTQQHGMMDIKLIKREPPYIAIFNIASSLREALNDGSDCFYSFTLPEDPNEMFRALERKLTPSQGNKSTLLANPKMPLFLKGFYNNSHEIVKSAFQLLTAKTATKQDLPAFGEENPEQIILDVYSASYLALTGLSDNLINSHIKIAITIETKFYIKQWLEDVNREDYLTIGVHPEGGLLRCTAEDMRLQTVDIQKALNQILTKSEVISPNLIDTPPEVLKIEDAVDPSVLSSLKLSITNNIPWLCIDLIFAQLSKSCGHPIVNALHFFTFLDSNLPIEHLHKGLYLHVTAGLPYPITYENIIQLSKSKEEHAHYFLAEILRMYPNASPNTNATIQFLHHILIIILTNAYEDGEILKGLSVTNPRNNGYTERVFNACCDVSMECKGNEEAHYKLAMLLTHLFHTFREITPIINLIRYMASRFIIGHIMCAETINNHVIDLITKIRNNEIS
ncbi:GapS6b family protein [Desulfotalea psychrophila]|nr:hypothetical protein [Desulfotalea psychrophila]